MAIDPTAPTTPAPASTTSRTNLSDNFDTFLVLLTAQLQNQDPLSPMDSAQFTQQLVQFSQVEQQIRTNENLESLITQQSAASASVPLSYLGKAALLDSNRTSLGGEEQPARWMYAFEDAPDSVKLTVKDAAGKIVYSEDGEIGVGAHAFTWDGSKTSGETAPPGVYTLTVTATDKDGAAVASDIHVTELISAVDFTTGSPRVVTQSGPHDLDEVLGIYGGQ